MTKRNSELVDILDGAPTTPSAPRFATSASRVDEVPIPAFELARVFTAHVAGAAAYVPEPAGLTAA